MEATNDKKNPYDDLSKEELSKKYKSLLIIAKKAKQAKDELFEENQLLKAKLLNAEISHRTEQSAQTEMRINELQKLCANLDTEKQFFQKRAQKLDEENEELLKDVDRLGNLLKMVKLLTKRQKEHLQALEAEVNKLKENEMQAYKENISLKQEKCDVSNQTISLVQKYKIAKDINIEQRKKFNTLKERFLEMHRKLISLKECKRVLLETHQDYHCSVRKWQKEITNAAELMYSQMNYLKKENDNLSLNRTSKPITVSNLKSFQIKVKELLLLSQLMQQEYINKSLQSNSQKESLEESSLKQLATGLLSNNDLIHSENYLKELQIELQGNIEAKENLLKRLELKELDYSKVLEEMQELKRTISVFQEKSNAENNIKQTLFKEINNTNLKLNELEQKFDSKEEEFDAKTEQLLQVNKTITEFENKLETMQFAAATNQEDSAMTENILGDFQKVCIDLDETKQKLHDASNNLQKSRTLNESLKAENQKLKSMTKQSNVLNLEIEAAEKSLQELSIKLANQASQLEEYKETLSCKENTIRRLHQDVDFLTTSKQAELEHSFELKKQIDHLHKELKDALHVKQNLLENMKTKDLLIEHLTTDLKSAHQSIEGVEKNNAASLASSTLENNVLQQKLNETALVVQSTENKLRASQQALTELRTEYTDYKIKAQVVLRNNQCKDTPNQLELRQELLALQISEKELRIQADIDQHQLAEKKAQIELLREDVDKIQTKEKSLNQEVLYLRHLNETLNQEKQKLLQIQKETIANQKEFIDQKDKIHSRKVNELMNQIETLMNESVKESNSLPLADMSKQSEIKSDIETDNNKEAPFEILMAREDAEGSEEAGNSVTYQRSVSLSLRYPQSDFLPLETLLNTPLDRVKSIQKEEVIDDLYLDLEKTKDRLQMQESRVRHLTALLSENEQDLAKLSQMNDMLKEELRKQDRGIEREKHLHNLEYLKNIIIKFATLSNNDEKVHLVPVLSTILKLNPSETEAINATLKEQNAFGNNIGKSWSNILQSWNKN